MLLRRCVLFSYLFLAIFAQNFATAPALIPLRGYLGKEQIDSARKTLEQVNTDTLIIEINSSSGNLKEVLDLAKKIYALKVQNHVRVIVFIEDNAIGPAAIIPFLADELNISLFVSWGSIPLGNEKIIPINLLRNQVTSLVSNDNPNANLLKLMASAMADPSIQIVEDNGWKIATDVTDKSLPRVSTPGETLVVNHSQLTQLGIVSGVMTLEQFYQQWHLSSTQQTQLSTPVEATPLAISSKGLEEKLAAHIKYSPVGPNFVGHIIIDDRTSGINESTWLYVKQALEHYKEIKPIFVILELNTPGGEVYAAQKISDALKELDTQDNIPVVAFINNWAISAGAMLAYSCRFIAITKDASMGAAEPILASSSGEMKEASEKINSALRTDFANRARFFDRNPDIAESMVDKDIILVLRHGKIVRLDSESQIVSTGSEPDIIISPKGKLLTLTAEQMIAYGVADILLLPAKIPPITEAEKESGKWPANKMLLFQQPFFAKIPNAVVDSYRMDWKTRFFVLLASPVVSSLLMLGLMMGLYLEFTNPGLTLPGTIAGLCLFLIILSSLSLQIANWLEVILLVSGILIILIDLFVLPTFGLIGVIGVVLFVAGLFGMMLPSIGSVNFDVDTHTLNSAGLAFFERLAWLCGTFILGFILMFIVGRFVTPKLGAWSRLVLTGSEQNGYIAGDSPNLLPQPGAKGEVLSTLRPAGKVIIDDKIYDALTAGSFIEKGMPIVVERLEGSVIVVEVLKK